MSIVRKAKRRSNFTTISNEAPQNSALSYRAIGLWTYLMTKPDHWKAKVSHLAEQHTEGREAVRSALVELEEAGYVVRRWVRRPGSATPTREYVVYETLDEAREDQAEGGTERADSEGCDHFVGLPRNPSSRPGESTRHDRFSGTQEPAASKYSALAIEEEEIEDDEVAIERYCAAHGLDPTDAIDDDGDPVPANLDDQLVAEIARRALVRRRSEQPDKPVRLPGKWLERASGRIQRSDRMRLAVHAVRHPALGCAGREHEQDLQLEALVHVHRDHGSWPEVVRPRRIEIIDHAGTAVSTDVDSSGERAPMPSSVRDALKGTR